MPESQVFEDSLMVRRREIVWCLEIWLTLCLGQYIFASCFNTIKI